MPAPKKKTANAVDERISSIRNVLERGGAELKLEGVELEGDPQRDPETRNLLASKLLEAYSKYGIAEAFDTLFELTAPSLTGLIRERCVTDSCPLTIDEIISETYWQIFRRAHSFRSCSPRAFENWALTIAINVVRQELRRRSRQSVRERAVAVDDVDSASNPLTRLLRREQRSAEQSQSEWAKETLDRCLADLPEITQECLRLAAFDGMVYREIGARLGLSEAAVTMRIRRARKKARALLEGRREAGS